MSVTPLFNRASLADRLAFDELAEDVKQMVVRLYGFDFRSGEPDTGIEPAAASLRDAFMAGWEECAEEFERPYFHQGIFERWQERRKRRREAA